MFVRIISGYRPPNFNLSADFARKRARF